MKLNIMNGNKPYAVIVERYETVVNGNVIHAFWNVQIIHEHDTIDLHFNKYEKLHEFASSLFGQVAEKRP